MAIVISDTTECKAESINEDKERHYNYVHQYESLTMNLCALSDTILQICKICIKLTNSPLSGSFKIFQNQKWIAQRDKKLVSKRKESLMNVQRIPYSPHSDHSAVSWKSKTKKYLHKSVLGNLEMYS